MKNALRMYLLVYKRKLNLFYRKAIRQFFYMYIALSAKRYIVVSIEHPSLANYFCGIIGIAWLCEKINDSLNINLEFLFPKESSSFFENSLLYSNHSNRALTHQIFLINSVDSYLASISRKVARREIASEYGYKIITRLSIKQDIRDQADEWFNAHINDDWVAVHYRGTDTHTDPRLAKRLMTMESYISYLKEVLDDHCSIFVCSDQAQFMDKMQSAFPGRVYLRHIKRSTGTGTLHLQHDNQYSDEQAYQQKRDALIDILIASKAYLVYTTGSQFMDTTRYFNPNIKIVSLDRRIERRSAENYIPIPNESLLQKLQASAKSSRPQ